MLITGPHTMCVGSSITLSAEPGFTTYHWYPDNQTTQSIVVSPSVSTTYYVVATNPNEPAVTSVTHYVTVYETPVPTFQYLAAITTSGEVWEDIVGTISGVDNNIQLRTKEAFSEYQWYLNGDPIQGATYRYYTAIENGNYHVRVRSNRGCYSTDDTSYSLYMSETPGCAITLLQPTSGAKSVPTNVEVVFDVRFNFIPIPVASLDPETNDITVIITDGDAPVRYGPGNMTIYGPDDLVNGTNKGYRYVLTGIRFRAGSPIKIRVKVGTPIVPGLICTY